MGRYYHGDIEGKFWFAVQSSMAAERFGGEIIEPNYVDFYFDGEHLDNINAEIDRIEKGLGGQIEVINNFFIANGSYNDTMLDEAKITHKDIEEYADLELGKKIRDCVVNQGECNFSAEL